MEKMKGIDRKDSLINEILQGIEFAKELRNHFMNSTNDSSLPSSSLSDDNHNQAHNFSILEKLLSTFDKTISIAKLLHFQANNQDPSISHDHLTMSSSKSENSHPIFPPSKRRRSMMPKWSKTVKISNGGSLDDGFSWRKYGQKDILGAQFPRAYYRCTHRFTRNCDAIKQVQRTDKDPTIYQIMYKGEHTCTQGAHLKKAQLNPIIPAQINSQPQPPPLPSPQQQAYVGQGPKCDIKVEPQQEPQNQAHTFGCVSFTQAHQQLDPIDDIYMLSFCPAFGSPPQQTTVAHGGLTVQTSETGINEAGSGLNSVTNSPAMGGCDFEFSLSDELLDFGGNFYFDFEKM